MSRERRGASASSSSSLTTTKRPFDDLVAARDLVGLERLLVLRADVLPRERRAVGTQHPQRNARAALRRVQLDRNADEAEAQAARPDRAPDRRAAVARLGTVRAEPRAPALAPFTLRHGVLRARPAGCGAAPSRDRRPRAAAPPPSRHSAGRGAWPRSASRAARGTRRAARSGRSALRALRSAARRARAPTRRSWGPAGRASASGVTTSSAGAQRDQREVILARLERAEVLLAAHHPARDPELRALREDLREREVVGALRRRDPR